MTSSMVLAADLKQSVEDVLSSFAGQIEPGPGVDSVDEVDTWLEAWVRITGAWEGEVALDVLGASAPAFAGAMLGTPPGEVAMEDTADALCELVNMIGGQVKGSLPDGCRMSLPLIRMRRRNEGTATVRGMAEAATRTFDWAGHPLRVTIRTAP